MARQVEVHRTSELDGAFDELWKVVFVLVRGGSYNAHTLESNAAHTDRTANTVGLQAEVVVVPLIDVT
jgi:hypothetical protein